MEGATLLIPPEFTRQSPLGFDVHAHTRPGYMMWGAPPTCDVLKSQSIEYHWNAPVAFPGGYRARSEWLQERRECQWMVQGRTARVVTGLVPDPWDATGGKYHTIAAWADVQPGVHLWVFARAESAAEQERLFAVFQSLRFR
jgi:hypothetical protein